jgi:hypothetical protein
MAEKPIVHQPVQPEVPQAQEADFERLTEFMNPIQARQALGIAIVKHEVTPPSEATHTKHPQAAHQKGSTGSGYTKPLYGWKAHIAESLPDSRWNER